MCIRDRYKGTANAIYQNIAFIERYDPDDVIILSGDHIYKMDYAAMLRYHEQMEADCTIAVRTVPLAEASRFGIMNTREDGSIYEFEMCIRDSNKHGRMIGREHCCDQGFPYPRKLSKEGDHHGTDKMCIRDRCCPCSP